MSCQTPVGHGAVLSISIYGGDDLDFADCGHVPASVAATHNLTSALSTAGGGEPTTNQPVRKDRVWIDVWSEVELDEGGRPIMDGRYVSAEYPDA